MRPLHHLLPLLAMSLVALASSGCYGVGVNPLRPAAVRPRTPPRLTRSGSPVGTRVLLPSGAQVATDAHPHRVRVYRSPEWDPGTTARAEVVTVGGLMVVTLLAFDRSFLMFDRWNADPLCRAFSNAPDETTPMAAGIPFMWSGMKGDRWFRDWCRSYGTQVRVSVVPTGDGLGLGASFAF
jgi:hypothetical protein